MSERGGVQLIEPELAQEVLDAALVNGGDLAEVYCEERSGLSLSIDEQRLERAQQGRELGAGVRVISGETS